ncbi:hydroxysqualene dehydroxylase HpnE [Ramlibacter rhizophilus]|uniref:Desaturase n=1 Tax=Ramlibacter rhizophilus TaxID=1781167 RepID=A0A4Z0BEC8_9BURK|nr:hydroxysqualene dehydroxylase HpnE [Ramlibacter rhizophilus]TFY96823.1 desaturase [Ramlibacter rhizophilus]
MARIAVVGAGWAGLAAAVHAVRAGHAVDVFEAARVPGGRARSLEVALPGRDPWTLDNGQHILIGAYTETLSLMQAVGVAPARVLHAQPLRLLDAHGQGLALPAWPAPLDAAWGIARARGWDWRDKASLLAAALRWRRAGFRCEAGMTVAALCTDLRAAVVRDLIEPLCVAALNTPAQDACGQVFLRVLRDALFGRGWGGWGGAWLLLPREPLGRLFPEAACEHLRRAGARVHLGQRVNELSATSPGWRVDGESYDALILACASWDAVRLLEAAPVSAPQWLARARALRHEGIATVYASGGPRLAEPMLALSGGPAQFVFDRAQLGGPPGLLAFVASASRGTREELEAQVLAQARAEGWEGLSVLQTVVEKRATFACTPGLQRPGQVIAPGLWACGDYVEGPYPATLEGAVRSACAVVQALPP